MAQTYYLVVYLASATDPADDATGHGQIKNGQDGSGATAAFAGSTSWTGSPGQIDITGLSDGTLYGWAAVVYDDVLDEYSNRVLGTETLTSIAVPAASIQRQAFAPTVTATANQTIAVPLASREIQAFAPTVSTSSDVTIDVPLATRQIQAFAPTVQAPRNIAVPAASIERQAFAPTVTVSADRIIQVPLASVERQAFAPTVATTATIAVGVASKQWQAFAPTVTTEATTDEITGRAVRRYRRRIQRPEPEPIEPSAPVVALQPVRTPVPSLIPDANTLIVEQAGRARKLAKTAEQKRRIAVELDDERALSEALMEWF